MKDPKKSSDGLINFFSRHHKEILSLLSLLFSLWVELNNITNNKLLPPVDSTAQQHVHIGLQSSL